MPHTMLPTAEDIISDILNWVCPECSGPMGKRTKSAGRSVLANAGNKEEFL